MIECKKCHGKMKTLDSRHAGPRSGIDYVRRRRVCESCGYRVSTAEVNLALWNAMRATIKTLRKRGATMPLMDRLDDDEPTDDETRHERVQESG